jgi:thymidine kinase
MDLSTFKTGKLDIIIGCMFSGKSTELQKRIKKSRLIYDNILVINHISDKRYCEGSVCTHDHHKMNAITLDLLVPLTTTLSYENVKSIFIDEGQFFPDLLDFIRLAVERDNKYVVVCGLDTDFKRQPFGQMISLIPLCDSIIKLKALCLICRNGTKALFSHRKIENNIDKPEEIHIIGIGYLYEPLCRKHYLEKNIHIFK